jgi:multiple sugar transport system permease protein
MAVVGATLARGAGRVSQRLDRLSERAFALVVSIPSLALVALVVLPPTLFVFGLSLFRVELAKDNRTPFVGLANFLTRLPADQFVIDAIPRTILFAALITAVTLPLALLTALVLNHGFRGASLFFIVLLMPWAVSPIVTGIFFRIIFDTQFGIANDILTSLGITQQPVNFLESTAASIAIAVIATAWRSAPLLALLILAALRTIPSALYRAAKMDGATSFQSFRHVTLPAIRPTLFIVAILQIIIGLQTFDILYSLTSGGPGHDTYVLIYSIYDSAFRDGSFGYAAAITVLLFFLILGCSLLLLLAQFRRRRAALSVAVGPDPDDLTQPMGRGLRFDAASDVGLSHYPEAGEPRRLVRIPPRLGGLFFGLGVVLLFVFFVAPIVWITIASLQPPSTFNGLPLAFTPNLWLNGYVLAMTNPKWTGSLFVSVATAVSTMVLVIAIASPAAYSLARFRLPGKQILLAVLIFTQMVPAIVMAIPVLRLFQIVHLTDTIQSLVIVNVAFWLPLMVWLLRNFFADVPIAIERAARIDGATRLGTLFRITIPAARPGIAAAAILILIGTWNEFLFAVVLGNHNAVTVTRRIIGLTTLDFGEQLVQTVPPANELGAAGMISVLPCLVLVALFHRRIIAGLTEGLKG